MKNRKIIQQLINIEEQIERDIHKTVCEVFERERQQCISGYDPEYRPPPKNLEPYTDD